MADHLHHRHAHVNHQHELMRRAAHAHSVPIVDSDSPSPATIPEPSRVYARDDSTSSCTDHTSPGCQLPESASNNTGAIIGVSVAIPLALALIVLLVLHRRATRRQAAEDAKDAQENLDFGIDPKYKTSPTKGRGRKGKKGGPEMTVTDLNMEKELRKGGHGTGMSLDLGNPYILPPEMNGSRDSLHSMTRSLTDKQDPYRMVGQQSPSTRPFGDTGSIRSGSDRGLLANPGPNPMSRSQSPLVTGSNAPASIPRKQIPEQQQEIEPPVNMPTFDFTDHSATDARPNSTPHASQKSVDVDAANRLSNQDKSLPATPQDGLQSPPPRGASIGANNPYEATNNAGPVDPYEFQEVVVPPSPDAESRQNAGNAHLPSEEPNGTDFPYPPPPEPQNENRMTLGLGLDLPAGNRLSVLRPLPPDDPNDTAESRANRIRSFYKEYFADGDAHVHDTSGFDYYEDYGDEYLQDGAVFDPETGQFIVAQAPYADPITRRAMTPPPRGPPPKFRGGPRRPGHASSGSSPGVGPRGRAHSNASTSRMGGPRGRQAKRPLPPPSALKNLPTPHLLRENDFNLAGDFAPPRKIRDAAAGRAPSPLLGDLPYSPTVPIAKSPLASAYTELAVVPSPHSLRKSGTFTALDFVPPPKFRDPEGGGSDAGSIRSGRSNFSAVSARQQQNVRAGAYRLSRVPKNLVGSRNELMDSLKPTWNIGS